jgi:hypothetical protein
MFKSISVLSLFVCWFVGTRTKAGDKVAPGKSIGGDVYRNISNPMIPEPDVMGRIWYEADKII